MNQNSEIIHIIREETTFASIREPVKELGPTKELEHRIIKLKKVLEGHITGPLTLIFHFDTLVDGYDAEIGYPVDKIIEKDSISTKTLPYAEFLSVTHKGSYKTLRTAYEKIYQILRGNGLSDALELVEILHKYNFENQENCITEVQGSFLMWDRNYKMNLKGVL